MGFFSRLPIPRGMRRATHPEHAVTQAAAPEAVEVANGAPRPAVGAGHRQRRRTPTPAPADEAPRDGRTAGEGTGTWACWQGCRREDGELAEVESYRLRHFAAASGLRWLILQLS